MTKVGVYLGTKDDPVENICEVLHAWGNYLSRYNVETFGSTALPQKFSETFNHIKFEEKSFRSPFGKINIIHRQCIKYIQQRSPDVVIQLWKTATHGPGIVLAGKRTACPTIVRVTGDVFNEYKGYDIPYNWGVFLLTNGGGKISLRLADRVIALGPSTAKMSRKHGAKGDNIVCLPPPRPNGDQFYPIDDPKPFRKSIGLDPDQPVVLYVGRLTSQKGMPFLMDVIENVHERTPYKFLLVGDGPYAERFENEFSDSTVELAGYVPHERIDKYYKAASVYIHPSAYEGIPLTILEALTCEVPVVARNAGDIGFVTRNTVQSSTEMGEMLLHRQWETGWLHKEYFEHDFQREVLSEVIEQATLDS